MSRVYPRHFLYPRHFFVPSTFFAVWSEPGQRSGRAILPRLSLPARRSRGASALSNSRAYLLARPAPARAAVPRGSGEAAANLPSTSRCSSPRGSGSQLARVYLGGDRWAAPAVPRGSEGSGCSCSSPRREGSQPRAAPAVPMGSGEGSGKTCRPIPRAAAIAGQLAQARGFPDPERQRRGCLPGRSRCSSRAGQRVRGQRVPCLAQGQRVASPSSPASTWAAPEAGTLQNGVTDPRGCFLTARPGAAAKLAVRFRELQRQKSPPRLAIMPRQARGYLPTRGQELPGAAGFYLGDRRAAPATNPGRRCRSRPGQRV